MILTKRMIDAQLARVRAIDSDPGIDDICGTGDELLQIIAAQPTRETPVAPPRPITKREANEVETDLACQRLFGEDFDETATLPEPFRKLAQQEKREALAALVGPARAAEDRQVRKAALEIERDLRVTGHLKRLRGEKDTGELLRDFLRAYGENDEAGMRAVARHLVAA